VNDYSLIKDIGRSYIVSSFIPTALFITVGFLIFSGFTPNFITPSFISNDQFIYITQWGFLLIISTWTSFALYSGWHFTVNLYEGYPFKNTRLGKWLTKQKKKQIRPKVRIIRRVHRAKNAEEFGDEEERILEQEQAEANIYYRQLQEEFPFSIQTKMKLIMPTRLGNVLRASEYYPKEKYGFDGMLIWSRMIHLCPAPYREQLEESNNKFIFLLNSSFLSYLISAGCFLVSLLRLPCAALNPAWLSGSLLKPYSSLICPPIYQQELNFFQRGFEHLSEGEYFLLGILFCILGYLIYRIAVIQATDFTAILRSGFDLYRFEVLKALHISPPNNLKEEKSLWETVCHLLTGLHELDREDVVKPLEYDQAKPSKEPPPKEPPPFTSRRKKTFFVKIIE